MSTEWKRFGVLISFGFGCGNSWSIQSALLPHSWGDEWRSSSNFFVNTESCFCCSFLLHSLASSFFCFSFIFLFSFSLSACLTFPCLFFLNCSFSFPFFFPWLLSAFLFSLRSSLETFAVFGKVLHKYRASQNSQDVQFVFPMRQNKANISLPMVTLLEEYESSLKSLYVLIIVCNGLYHLDTHIKAYNVLSQYLPWLLSQTNWAVC